MGGPVFLRGRAGVARVIYPGLIAHTQHDLAARQMPGGFGGMVTVVLDGDLERIVRAPAARGGIVGALLVGRLRGGFRGARGFRGLTARRGGRVRGMPMRMRQRPP